MKKIQTVSLTKIKDFAKDVASQLQGGELLALVGPLGSGKTTFAKALGKQLGVKHHIASPTFTLMQVYMAKLPKNRQPVFLYHLDLYRTKNFREVKALGITEVWQDKNVVTLVEWADQIKKHWPKNTWLIKFMR
jgi:tRNA threonylcarbamoyladenosine biosynthesis protein TsaE